MVVLVVLVDNARCRGLRAGCYGVGCSRTLCPCLAVCMASRWRQQLRKVGRHAAALHAGVWPQRLHVMSQHRYHWRALLASLR
jgi:hypothetical protein